MELDSVLAPFTGKVYCNYFYVLMIISLLLLTGTVASLVFAAFNKFKGFSVLLLVLINNFLVYFNLRLVYSMCINSMA
tara:strand:- start:798 stop:1031 length:234 start_codon:yes stop_codon:yes gene_type:complete